MSKQLDAYRVVRDSDQHGELERGVERALRRGVGIERTVKLTGMPYEEVAKVRDRLRRKRGVVR